MSFHSRLFWMFIGYVAGAILGYIVRWIQESLELRAVMNPFKNTNHSRIQSIGLALIVLIVAAASFRSQINSNRITNSQKQFKKISSCNEQFVAEVISALNSRTTFSSEQAAANINLQNAQANFLRTITKIPPITMEQGTVALSDYISALTTYLDVQKKQSGAQIENPYPTTSEFSACVNAKGK